MSRSALKRSEIPLTEEEQAGRDQRTAAKQAKEIVTSLSSQNFAQLTPEEKDNLLKALALQAGLIQPD